MEILRLVLTLKNRRVKNGYKNYDQTGGMTGLTVLRRNDGEVLLLKVLAFGSETAWEMKKVREIS